MKVQQIKNSANFNGLEDRGTIESLTSALIRLSGLRKAVDGSDANTGLFECTAGSYRRIVMEPEVMHILQGKGSFTADNEDTIGFEAGDTLFFDANTRGVWEVLETMRKFYVIL